MTTEKQPRQQPAPPTTGNDTTRPPRTKRRRRVVLILLALTPLVLIALLPTIIGHSPLAAYLVRRAARLDGTISFRSASIGWFTPTSVSDIEIRDVLGQPVLTATHLGCDRSLLYLLANPSNAGTLRIDKPILNAQFSGDGSNLESLLARWLTAPVSIAADRLAPGGTGSNSTGPGRNVELSLEIVGGEATVVDRHRLLRFVIPVLDSVTQSQGQFSIELEGARIPFGDLQRAEIAGRVIVHSATMGPGPLVEQLASLAGVSPTLVRIQPESVIQFRMTGGRIYHQGLTLEFPNVTVQTYGSVGLDESLKLMVETSVPLRWLPDNAVTENIKQQKLQIPIGGTLKSPRLDLAELARVKNQVLGNLARDVLQSGLGSRLDRLLRSR